MLSIIITLLPIFGIMAIGYVAERRQMLPVTTSVCLNQFVYWFSLPLLVFEQMARMRPEQILPATAGGFLLGTAVAYALSFRLQKKVLKDETRECYVVAMVSTFPNSAFMGLPIIFLLMPGDAAAAVAASIVVVLTAAPMLYSDTALGLSPADGKGAEGRSWWAIARKVCCALLHNPVMVCTAFGAMAGLSRTELPAPLLTTAHMLGSTAAPCALFCMGMSLSAQVGALAGKSWGLKKRQVPMALCKLVVAPLLVFIFSYALGERGTALASTTIMSSMPTAVVGYIVAEKHATAAQDCSTGIVANTLLSAFSIPLVIMCLRWGGVLPE